MNLSQKLIHLLDEHLNERYNKEALLAELSKYPNFIEEHLSFRALIGHSDPLKIGDSFSFSKEGLKFVLDGHTDRLQGEEVDLTIYQANVVGYNLKKIILLLKDQGVFDEYNAKLSNEDEIIALEIKDIQQIYSGDFWSYLEKK